MTEHMTIVSFVFVTFSARSSRQIEKGNLRRAWTTVMSQSAPSRADLLHNAILFLTDPKVSSSSLASKINFLEGKGLNEDEIQEALRRAGSSRRDGDVTSGISSERFNGAGTGTARGGGLDDFGYGTRVMPRALQQQPEPPRRDWRDLFVSDTSPFLKQLGICMYVHMRV